MFDFWCWDGCRSADGRLGGLARSDGDTAGGVRQRVPARCCCTRGELPVLDFGALRVSYITKGKSVTDISVIKGGYFKEHFFARFRGRDSVRGVYG